MSQPDSTSLLHGPEIIPPAALNRLPEVRSDMSPIVLRWQHLASMDRQSPDFLPSLASLAAERDRSSTTALRGDDARATLSLIDEVSLTLAVKAITYVTRSAQVLRDDDIPGKHRSDALCTMRTLAYNSGQIPSHYQADRQSLSVEAHIIASSAFAEVRKGRLGDKTVAVRVLRIDRQTDLNDARKVCTAFNSLTGIITSGPSNLALLQGVHHLDEPFSSQPLRTHRRRYRPSQQPVLDDFGDDDQWVYYGVYWEESSK